MTGFADSKADRAGLKAQLNKNIAQGEKLMGFYFDMKIEGYPDFELRVRTTQYPAMGYELAEDFGQGGLKMNQQGALQNSQEITSSCVENLKGDTLKVLKDIILNKKQVKITFAAKAESLGGGKVPFTSCTMDHCILASEAIEFSTEDTTAIVKPSFTITTSWVDHD